MISDDTIFDKNEKTIYEKDENTVMNGAQEEETTFEDDQTTIGDDKTEELQQEPKAEEPAEPKESHRWQKVVIGGAAGLCLGATASFLTTSEAVAAKENAETKEPDGTGHHHPLVDDSLPMADTVTDDMSFGEAFAAARAEIGPAGAFEWHGNIYSTYTAAEWDSMSQAEQDEFNSNFKWNQGSSSAESNYTAKAETQEVKEETPENKEEMVENKPKPEETDPNKPADKPEDGEDVNVVGVDVDHDVEVLGVAHDEDSGMNMAGVLVDGQEVILFDTDGDEVFDVMAVDVNHDGQLTEGEVAQLQTDSLTVDSLGGFTDGSDLANNDDDGPDYINDDPSYA